MSVVNITCTDQVLAITNSPVLASGGQNENFIQFEFSSEWDGYGKACMFYRQEGDSYYALLDSDDMCVIPSEASAGAGRMYIGIIGVSPNSTVRTSELITYRIVAGAITEVPDPSPSLYQQILSELASLRADVAQAIENVESITAAAVAAATADAEASATAAAKSETAAEGSAEDSEAWAIGERAGVAVPSDDETYHNNAKYWANQAAQAAGGGVLSFNGRSGYVDPATGDYTPAMVGAAPAIHVKSVSLPVASWSGTGPWSQTVTITGYIITANSQVNVDATVTLLAQAMDDGFGLFFENDTGTVKAWAVGEKPTADLTVPVTIVEVSS